MPGRYAVNTRHLDELIAGAPTEPRPMHNPAGEGKIPPAHKSPSAFCKRHSSCGHSHRVRKATREAHAVVPVVEVVRRQVPHRRKPHRLRNRYSKEHTICRATQAKQAVRCQIATPVAIWHHEILLGQLHRLITRREIGLRRPLFRRGVCHSDRQSQ